MLKKMLIALGALMVLLIILVILFLNWAENPFGLEEERLGPKGNEKILLTSSVPNAQNYLLFPKHEGNSFAIHLPLPHTYVHPSNAKNHIMISYGVSATMYYPNLEGKFHPSNVNLPKCNGWCGGYLRAYIDAGKNTSKMINSWTLERIQKDRLAKSPFHLFEDLESEFGLNDHFQIRNPVIEEKSNGNKNSTLEYLFKRSLNGEVQYIFECRPYSPSPGCSVKFNLSSRPELLVDIHFGRHLMKNWENIIKSVDKKITSWGLVRINATLE